MTTINIPVGEPPTHRVEPGGYFPSETAVPGRYYVAVICPRCGESHRHERCPDVRAIEYYPDGRVKRVEYFEETGARPLQPKLTISWAAPPSGNGAVVKEIAAELWAWSGHGLVAPGVEEEE